MEVFFQVMGIVATIAAALTVLLGVCIAFATDSKVTELESKVRDLTYRIDVLEKDKEED